METINVTDLISLIPFCLNNDALRPALCGCAYNGSTLVATDANVLRVIKYPKNKKVNEIIIPLDFIKLLKRHKVKGVKEYLVSEGMITVYDNYSEYSEYSYKLIDDKYPNWPAVVPEEKSKQIVINTQGINEIISNYEKLYKSNKTKHKDYIVYCGSIYFNAKLLKLTVCNEFYIDHPLKAAVSVSENVLTLLMPVFATTEAEEISPNLETTVTRFNFLTPNKFHKR